MDNLDVRLLSVLNEALLTCLFFFWSDFDKVMMMITVILTMNIGWCLRVENTTITIKACESVSYSNGEDDDKKKNMLLAKLMVFRIRCSTICLKAGVYYRVNWVSKEQGLFIVLYPHWLLINSSHNIEKIRDSFATSATERNCQPPPGASHYSRVLSPSFIFSYTTIASIFAYVKCIVSYYCSRENETLREYPWIMRGFHL